MSSILDGKEVQVYDKIVGEWCVFILDTETSLPLFSPTAVWRIKPKTLQYRNALFRVGLLNRVETVTTPMDADNVERALYFVKWLGDWQEVEI